jgi:hypothetical protein
MQSFNEKLFSLGTSTRFLFNLISILHWYIYIYIFIIWRFPFPDEWRLWCRLTMNWMCTRIECACKGILDTPASSSIKYILILVVCMVWYYMNDFQAKRSQYEWVFCEYLSFVLSMKFAIIHSPINMYSIHFRWYIKDIKLDLDATFDWCVNKSGATVEEGDLTDDASHGVSCNMVVCG